MQTEPRIVPGFIRLTEGNFHPTLARTQGVALVLFTTPHCGACRAWKQQLRLALDGIVEHWFEVDVAESTGLARAADIFHLPAMHLYRAGVFHADLQCEAASTAIRATTHRLLDAPAQDEP